MRTLDRSPFTLSRPTRLPLPKGKLAVVVLLAGAVFGPGFLSQGRAQELTPPNSQANLPAQPASQPVRKPADKYKFDKDRKYLWSVKDFKEPENRPEADRTNEFEAYCSLVAHAHQFTAEELIANAASAPWKSLLTEDQINAYRYDLLKFDGKLSRIIKFSAPGALEPQKIDTLYEAWIFTEKEDRPICVVLTELPEGLEPSKEYSPPKQVTVAGYFFKGMSYESSQKSSKTGALIVRRAPLLMSRSLVVAPESPTGLGGWTTGFLPAVIISIVSLSALVLGMAWWFRSSDRKTKAVLRKHATNPYPEHAEMEPAPDWLSDHPPNPPPTHDTKPNS